MKPKSTIRKLLETLVFLNVILVILVFIASKQMVFLGALEGYDAFNIIYTHEEDDRFLLIRANNETKQDVVYALHTSYPDAVVVVMSDDVELMRIHSSEIPEQDFYTFQLENMNRKEICIALLSQQQEILEITFLYLDNYHDSIGLAYQDNLMQNIYLEEVKTTRNIRDDDILTPLIVTSFGILLIVGVVYLLLRSQTARSELDDVYKEKDKPQTKEHTKTIKVVKYLSINAFLGLLLTILTIYLLVLLFSEESFTENPYEMDQDSVLFAIEDDPEFGFVMHIGVRKYAYYDGEINKWSVIYSIRTKQDFEEVYIISIDCNQKYHGRAFTDMGVAYNKTPSSHYGEIEIDDLRVCENSLEFRLVIRDPNTAMILFESESYPLYQDAFLVMEHFEIDYDNAVPLFTLYVFLFHSIVSASLLRIVYNKVTPRINRMIKKEHKINFNKY